MTVIIGDAEKQTQITGGGFEQKNKCEEKKEDKKFCCFCHEFEKKQDEKKQCTCGNEGFGKQNYGCEYNNYGYGHDNFYSQGY